MQPYHEVPLLMLRCAFNRDPRLRAGGGAWCAWVPVSGPERFVVTGNNLAHQWNCARLAYRLHNCAGWVVYRSGVVQSLFVKETYWLLLVFNGEVAVRPRSHSLVLGFSNVLLTNLMQISFSRNSLYDKGHLFKSWRFYILRGNLVSFMEYKIHTEVKITLLNSTMSEVILVHTFTIF